jgi:hypothetical protein
MAGKLAADGKTAKFDFLDVTNFSSTQHVHMQHAVVTMLDPNPPTEDGIFMMEGDKPMNAHLDLQRTK